MNFNEKYLNAKETGWDPSLPAYKILMQHPKFRKIQELYDDIIPEFIIGTCSLNRKTPMAPGQKSKRFEEGYLLDSEILNSLPKRLREGFKQGLRDDTILVSFINQIQVVPKKALCKLKYMRSEDQMDLFNKKETT